MGGPLEFEDQDGKIANAIYDKANKFEILRK